MTVLKYKIDVNELGHQTAAKILELNEICLRNLSLLQPLAMVPYEENRNTGSFILIDRYSNQTVAAGLVKFGLRRAENIHWQAVDVDKGARASLKHQTPKVLWFTGLSGLGTSTIANLEEQRLHGDGQHTYVLDSDNVRHGLNGDLGFADINRVENILRIGEVARLMVEAGLIVLTSFISHHAAELAMVRELLKEGEFIEIFVDSPLAVCEERDVNGLYARVRTGKIANFTGINVPYETAVSPEMRVDTVTAEEAANASVHYIETGEIGDGDF
ncbi:adenylyl-sulfate kinase [Cohaesibacter haloalkalitolerans]|uniref:adenylyl-sulfate kinase n=1 Tax=Cohaesibacter haloalkalitolerans TaxID=1162980 RepID=UPI001FE03EBF|nr:adenylyl-sulfate kinase [Cohaesibacter haloalkalitolerans]